MKHFIYFTLSILTAACTPKMLSVNAENAQASFVSETKEKNISEKLEVKTTEFVENLMEKMTIEEKIGQLNLLTPGGAVTGSVVSNDVEQKIKDGLVGGIFGIRGAEKVRRAQEIAVNESRLKIPLLVGMDVIHGHQTIFPIPLGLSCTWDMDLIKKTAQQAAREATADGLMWTFSPMVDISRDPRWGRISEGAGEDTFLSGEIAAAMVKGYQGDDLSEPETMLACVKHFANYGAAEGGRDYAATDMSRVKMFNEYLPPYKAAIDAGVETVMTSFNVIDYVPATANDFLYQKVLREEWGFNGFVVTDYTAVNEMIEHGMGDLQEVSALALKAGIDMDMVGEGFLTTLKKSVEEGKVTEAEIDRSCRKILEAKEKLGLFNDPFKYCDAARAEKEILSAANRKFAREVAAQSFVLLKNEDNILPLQKKGKIALIGPLADSRRNMLGTWSVSGDPNKSVTVLEGIKNAVGNKAEIIYAKGSNISNDSVFAKKVNVFSQEIVIDERKPEVMLREALKAAEKSDVIVAVMGESANMSGESSSMANIDLQPAQKELLEVLQRLGKPIVLVLYNGRPMTLSWENKNMTAILDVWFGGTEGGSAVADVLFGDVNPSGKLTTSFPVSVGQIPVYHSVLNTGRPTGNVTTKFKSNYLDIPNDPLYPFGFGLSYTTFKYGKPSVNQIILEGDDAEIIVSVEVTNTGNRAGAEVVQMYIQDVVGSISRPMKELKGFEKVTIEAGEMKKVNFSINRELLKFYNSDLEFVAEPGDYEVFVGGNSMDVQQVDFELR